MNKEQKAQSIIGPLELLSRIQKVDTEKNTLKIYRSSTQTFAL